MVPMLARLGRLINERPMTRDGTNAQASGPLLPEPPSHIPRVNEPMRSMTPPRHDPEVFAAPTSPKRLGNQASARKLCRSLAEELEEPMPTIPDFPITPVKAPLSESAFEDVSQASDARHVGQMRCLCQDCADAGEVSEGQSPTSLLPLGALAQSSGSTSRRRPRRDKAMRCDSCGKSIPGKPPPRLWCCFYLRMRQASFDLVPIVIGRGGCNTRQIAERTGAKVRVRGKGSGHREVSGKEAATPLMVAVTAEPNANRGFLDAVEQTSQLLHSVEMRYRDHCSKLRWAVSGPCFTISANKDHYKELRSRLGVATPPLRGSGN